MRQVCAVSTALEIARRNTEESRATAQLRMREQFPSVATIVDELRSVFGADKVKVRFAEEAGAHVGFRGPEGVKWSGPGNVPITRKAKIAAGVQAKKKPGKR